MQPLIYHPISVTRSETERSTVWAVVVVRKKKKRKDRKKRKGSYTDRINLLSFMNMIRAPYNEEFSQQFSNFGFTEANVVTDENKVYKFIVINSSITRK
jgi:hypothetical protein